MKLTYCPLFSGSSGNASFVEGGGVRILVDAGLSGKTICQALESIGILPETIQGILITHEHSDHIKAAGILSRKYRIPVYANALTWEAMMKHVQPIAPHLQVTFETNESFYIGNMCIHPFSVPHDAAQAVGYRIDCEGRSIGIATDMGYIKKAVFDVLSGCDLVLLESNFDPELLQDNPKYRQSLKNRILGRRGHLSNENCAFFIQRLYETGVRNFVLGHLSKDNNTPALAHRTVTNFLMEKGIQVGKDLQVNMSWRDKVGQVYTID